MHSFSPFWIFTTSSTFLWSHFFFFSPHFTTNTNDQFWLHHICRLPHCSSREKKKKMKQQKSDGTVWPRWWHTRMFFFLSLSEKNNILLLIILHRFVRSTFVTSAAHVKATYYHRICTRSPGRCSRGRRGLKGWRNCWFKLQQEKSVWNHKVAALEKKTSAPIFTEL